VESGTRTPCDTDSNVPDVEEACKSSQTETANVVRGSPLSATVFAVNETVLGLSPAVTLAGTYLSAGLASQLGFFSSANQYQDHSMVAMAATVRNVKRLLPGAKTKTSHQDQEPLKASSPAEPTTERSAAETAMADAGKAVQDTGF
jgi:hypothetical protein